MQKESYICALLSTRLQSFVFIPCTVSLFSGARSSAQIVNTIKVMNPLNQRSMPLTLHIIVEFFGAVNFIFHPSASLSSRQCDAEGVIRQYAVALLCLAAIPFYFVSQEYISGSDNDFARFER